MRLGKPVVFLDEYIAELFFDHSIGRMSLIEIILMKKRKMIVPGKQLVDVNIVHIPNASTRELVDVLTDV